MRKKISVLLATATAVTAVSPVVSMADSKTYAKILDMVSKAKSALDDKYDSKTSGLVYYKDNKLVDVPVTADYMKSKNIVLIYTDAIFEEGTKIPGVVLAGAKEPKEGEEKNDYYVDRALRFTLPENYSLSSTYIVKDAEGAQALLEQIAIQDAGAKMAIINKGADGSKSKKSSNKELYQSFEGLKTALSTAKG